VQSYPVPFHFDRSAAPHYRLINVGDERLRGVTALLHGAGVMLVAVPAALEPAASLVLPVYGRDLARGSSLTIRWLRPNGDEYAWRVVF
jgi:hypothetical protein